MTAFATFTTLDSFPTVMGPSVLVRMAFEGRDLNPLAQDLIDQMRFDPENPAVLMDLATVLLCQGGDLAAQGLILMAQAVRAQPTFVVRHGNGSGPVILAFVVQGDFMANTPLDFLLEGSDATLILHFVDDLPPRARDLPDHDVAFLAIGESGQSAAILNAIGPTLALWPRPVLNNAPSVLARLTRDRASQMLSGLPGVLAPLVQLVSRDALIGLAAGGRSPGDLAQGLDWPMLLRPIGSHAGQGLDLVAGQLDLVRWLSRETQESSAYLMPFVEYRGPEGLYSKYRVAMIGGRPFASHMAQSAHWMVHYLNADMDKHEDRRIEEAMWMARFDTGFAQRHAVALAAIQRQLGLDYYALDCAEAPDGRLLVFEVDTAMIIHNMDDPALYPYKSPAMRKLFDGFLAMVERSKPNHPPQKRRRVA